MFYFINKTYLIDYQRVTVLNLISQFPSSHFVQSPKDIQRLLLAITNIHKLNEVYVGLYHLFKN